jgi:uncharacterized Zn-binding protein involved in type VI secretion
MGKIIITVGDMTTHGGTVLVGDPTILIEGKPVARIGSTIICPLCKIPTVIVQGATLTLVNNIPVARHGDPTSCGAKLVSTRVEPACTVHLGNNVHVGSGVVFGSGVVWAPSSGGGGGSPPASSLAECESRVAEARERLKKEGYAAKYTDDELLAIAQQTEITDRFLVSLQKKKLENEPLGFADPVTRKSRFWGSTFDQVENGDSDPHLLTDIQGMEDPKPGDEYALYILDQGDNHEKDGLQAFSPTWKNMQDVGVKELSSKAIKPEHLRQVMTPEYQEKYIAAMDAFAKTKNPQTGKPLNQFNEEDADFFAKKHFKTAEEQELFKARHAYRKDLGASEHFLGTGVTKWKGGPQKYGSAETLTIEKNPKTIAELKASGKLCVIDCKPL